MADREAEAGIALGRGGVAEQIIADLKDQILRGVLPRGAKLPTERELAQRYQVSGPTIREAIRGLVAVNLVEVRHGNGSYVTAAVDGLFAMATSALIELEKINLLDIQEVMESLYVKAAALACVHASKAELAALSAALEALEPAADSAAVAAGLKRFLGQLADASHNVLVASLGKFLVNLLIEVAQEEAGGMMQNWPKISPKLKADRRRLVEALQARDVAQATMTAEKYHRHTRTLLKTVLEVEVEAGGEVARVSRAIKRMRQTKI
jgi:GntR family transcriptional regulator, transcriptional repressor for pyruvate dehydrogenase complex